MTNWQSLFSQAFPTLTAQFEYQLAEQTYFKIGGPAEIFLEATDLESTAAVIKWAGDHHCPLTIIGGASNVIVADQGIAGLVLKIGADAVVVHDHTVTAEAGCKTALLVSETVQAGLTGLEYFLGVPGTVGGAIFNNAHYLQHLVGEVVTAVKVITRQGEVKSLTAAECEFGYDHSRFQTSQEIIWQVTFSLSPGDLASSRALIKEATEYRAKTQPLGAPSSGCIFQNVPNTAELQALFPQFAERSHVPGGFLIDQAGLKGRRVGDIEVSQKHAAFMVNVGHGTAAQVKELVQVVKQTVQQKFGVHLQEEVFYLGN